MKRSDVAKRLGVSISQVRRYQEDGRLPARLDASGHHLFERDDVEALARTRRDGAAAEDRESDAWLLERERRERAEQRLDQERLEQERWERQVREDRERRERRRLEQERERERHALVERHALEQRQREQAEREQQRQLEQAIVELAVELEECSPRLQRRILRELDDILD